MTCEIVRDLIPMYIDGTASEETKKAIEEHLKTCEDCRRFCRMCRKSETKLRDKIFSKLVPGSEIDELDRQYALLSKKLKRRKLRQTLITIGVLAGMLVYIGFDIVRAVNKNNKTK